MGRQVDSRRKKIRERREESRCTVSYRKKYSLPIEEGSETTHSIESGLGKVAAASRLTPPEVFFLFLDLLQTMVRVLFCFSLSKSIARLMKSRML